MDFYLIYFPNGNNSQWEAMSDNNVPDTGAFPSYWYKKYEAPAEKSTEMFDKLTAIRNDMNKRKLLPSKDKNIFPELAIS